MAAGFWQLATGFKQRVFGKLTLIIIRISCYIGFYGFYRKQEIGRSKLPVAFSSKVASSHKLVTGSQLHFYVTKPLNPLDSGYIFVLFAYFCRAKKEYSGAKMFRLDKYKFYAQCGW